MKKKYLLTGCILMCALLFCSCSVKSKGSLIAYAKQEYGDCEFVKEDVKGSGNDKVRTVYLIDKDTGIEYKVTSQMQEMNLDGSTFGYSEYTSSNFTNLYVDYILEDAEDDLDEVKEEYDFELDGFYLYFNSRPSSSQVEEAATKVRDIIEEYDTKGILEPVYLAYAEDGKAYLGCFGEDGKWIANNVYEVIDYVQSVFPDAKYSASIYGLPESYVNTEDMEKLRAMGCKDAAAYDTEFCFFSDPEYGTLVAFNLEDIGLDGFLITEFDYSIPGDTLDCDALGIHH